MSHHERLSVIMPCYNCAKTVNIAVDSVLNQSYQDLKLYCVNDGSTDETSQILERYQRLHPDTFVLINQPNQGQTKAKNHAIEHAQGEFIALIDSDDVWQRDKCQKQIRLFDSHPEIGLCYTDGYYMDEKGHFKSKIGTEKGLNGKCLSKIMMGNAIVASSVMFRASLLKEVGLFDESLRACENWELWTRMAAVTELHAIQSPLIGYRQHDNNLSLNFSRMRESRIKVIEKNAKQFAHQVPNIKKMTREARFKTHQLFGETFLWHLKTKEARADLLSAILMRPTSIRCYKLFFKSLLGAFVLGKIRQIRGGQLARQIT